jgi:hypothetical protein
VLGFLAAAAWFLWRVGPSLARVWLVLVVGGVGV